MTRENIIFTAEDPGLLVKGLKNGDGKDIWICGGADIIRQLMDESLIDVYHISVIPLILGEGIRLFPDHGRKIKLKLCSVRNNNGITEMIYSKK